ncbi:MAG: hypothetical protein GC150_13155 [Rhizobiales bacterium]|nr:hypothetical protein [Hyphomicrobiales bacterium]
MQPPPNVLALDLEGTLISNAMSCFARPRLHAFLSACDRLFARVVLFTAVSEHRVRAITEVLVAEGSAPATLASAEIVAWRGPLKDLRFIEGADPARCLIVDDLESYIAASQKDRWIAIAPYAPPYGDEDRELARVYAILASRVGRADDEGPPIV